MAATRLCPACGRMGHLLRECAFRNFYQLDRDVILTTKPQISMTGTPPISFAHRCLIASATQQKAHPLRALTSQKPNPSPLGLSSEVSMTSEDTTDTTSITTATRGAGGAKSL